MHNPIGSQGTPAPQFPQTSVGGLNGQMPQSTPQSMAQGFQQFNPQFQGMGQQQSAYGQALGSVGQQPQDASQGAPQGLETPQIQQMNAVQQALGSIGDFLKQIGHPLADHFIQLGAGTNGGAQSANSSGMMGQQMASSPQG